MSNPQPPATPPPRNGLGTAGFVLGLLGLLFSFVPVVGVVAWPLVVVGLTLALFGLVRANRGQADNKGLAVAGIALSALGLVVCVLWAAVFTKATSDASDALDQLQTQVDRESVLVYEVTGDAPTATVSYSAFSDGGSSATGDEEVTSLPWTKEFTVKGIFGGGALTVTTGPDGGTVTCRITVDGTERKTSTGTGPHALADCSDY